MTHRLTTNYAKNYCNRTLIVKVIVENVVTCFLGGHSVDSQLPYLVIIKSKQTKQATTLPIALILSSSANSDRIKHIKIVNAKYTS